MFVSLILKISTFFSPPHKPLLDFSLCFSIEGSREWREEKYSQLKGNALLSASADKRAFIS